MKKALPNKKKSSAIDRMQTNVVHGPARRTTRPGSDIDRMQTNVVHRPTGRTTQPGSAIDRMQTNVILSETNIRDIWHTSYQLLSFLTPLKTDCGVLCGAQCCKGGTDDGMLLFPGEELLLTESLREAGAPSGFSIRNSNIILESTGKPVQYLTCQGKCTREMRPMACRIFPLLPYLDAYGHIRVKPDLRAYAMCPLLSRSDLSPIQSVFAQRVQKVFSMAVQIPGIIELLTILKDETDLIGRFLGLPQQ